jgi:hypothetical protein
MIENHKRIFACILHFVDEVQPNFRLRFRLKLQKKQECAFTNIFHHHSVYYSSHSDPETNRFPLQSKLASIDLYHSHIMVLDRKNYETILFLL